MLDFKSNINIILAVLLVAFFISCKKETQIIQDITVDNVIYEINDVSIYDSNVQKEKQKNNTQYISITYSDLYQKTITSNLLTDLSFLLLAFGDKMVMSEVIISNMLIIIFH